MSGEVLCKRHTQSVGVMRVNGEFQLLAVEPIPASQLIFEIEGELTHCPSRYSVQIGQHAHIDCGNQSLQEMIDRYHWRFMNHSCDPNLVIRGREVFALRTIHRWQELTFNYNTTEYDMAEPFDCRCLSRFCQGHVRGFKHISSAERERLSPWLAPYLLPLINIEINIERNTENS